MSDEQHQRIEDTASAIEDLLRMGVIRLSEKNGTSALFSPQFSQILSNLMADSKQGTPPTGEGAMKMMYYSLLIYMTEQLKLPRQFVMALGNDMEKNRESMESGTLVTRYVSILTELWNRSNQAQ